MQDNINQLIMKTNRQGLYPYEAPEAEVIETRLESGLLVLSGGETGNSTTEDLDEEDYSGSIIWN